MSSLTSSPKSRSISCIDLIRSTQLMGSSLLGGASCWLTMVRKTVWVERMMWNVARGGEAEKSGIWSGDARALQRLVSKGE